MPADGDLAQIGRALLVELAACADGVLPDACAVREDAAPTPPDGAAVRAAPDADVRLVEDYGGVAVLRVADELGPPQIVVIVDDGRKWLVRDVYDVADQ